jgi:uncharacterized membrane protein
MPTSRGIGAPLLHPIHAILLAFPLVLFTSGLISDIAYMKSATIQWTNFSSWLIAGGCFFGGLALAWALLVAAFPRRTTRSRAVAYLIAVAIMWTAGLINAFHHSHDGWSSVGATGVALSAVSALAAFVAAGIGHSGQAMEGVAR